MKNIHKSCQKKAFLKAEGRAPKNKRRIHALLISPAILQPSIIKDHDTKQSALARGSLVQGDSDWLRRCVWCIGYTVVRSALVGVAAGVVYYWYPYMSLRGGGLGYVGLGTDWDCWFFGAECFPFLSFCLLSSVGFLVW